MSNEVKLSKDSERFIENLRLYLFSTGKKMNEIDEIVAELTEHMEEAEADGKSINKIIGQSPKEYMESVANEMQVDYREWLKYILIIIIGSFSYIIAQDLLQGRLAYSILEITGSVVILGIFLLNIFFMAKYIASRNISGKKEILLLMIPAMLPTLLFLGLYALDGVIDTPIIYFGFWGSVVTGIVILLYLIGISLWAKLWAPIVVVLLLTIPDYLLAKTTLNINSQLILGMLISFGGVLIYFWISFGLFRTKEK